MPSAKKPRPRVPLSDAEPVTRRYWQGLPPPTRPCASDLERSEILHAIWFADDNEAEEWAEKLDMGIKSYAAARILAPLWTHHPYATQWLDWVPTQTEKERARQRFPMARANEDDDDA